MGDDLKLDREALPDRTRRIAATRAKSEHPERDEFKAQLDEAREAFATVAMKLLLNGEPTAGELREQLVKAGIDGPDRLSELASPPSEGTE